MPTDIFDQVAPAQDQQAGDIFDQVGAKPAQPAAAPAQPGFLESLGHTFGIGKEEAAARKQNLEQHPVRTILEDQPPVQAAEGLYQGSKRILGELGQAVQAGREGNPYGAAQHAIQATPFVGAGIQRGAEQLPAQQGVQNPLTPGVLGTVAGTAAQTAPMVAGGYSALRSGIAARLAAAKAPAAAPVPAPAEILPTPETVAPAAPPEGPAGGGGGTPPATPEPRPQAGSTGSPVAPQTVTPATQAAPQGKPTITLEHEPSLLDQITAHTETLAKLREQTAGSSPGDISALRDVVEETGRRAHDAGDVATAERAAHADIALSQLLDEAIANTEKGGQKPPPSQAANLNAAAAALTGKPISEVANPKGDIFDQVAGPKPPSKDDVAKVLASVPGAKKPEQRPVVQASTDPEQIQQSAEDQKPALKEMAQAAVAGVPGAKLEGARVKDAESVANKEDRGKPPETITDHLGARVSAPTPEAVAQVKQNIESALPVQGKDQIDSNGLNATQYAVQTGKPGEANQQSELQVVTTDQAKAMKATDPLYEKQKEALARGDQKEADRLGQQIKEHFDAAQPDQPAPLPDVIPKGTRVQLQDGRTGTVQWYDRTKQVARVKRDDGKEIPMVPRKAMQAAPGAQGEQPASNGGAKQEVGPQPVQQGQPASGAPRPIGEPIPTRIAQVKSYLANPHGQKHRVVIFTVEADNPAIHEALAKVGLGDLPVTNIKGSDFGALLDNDVNVKANADEKMLFPHVPMGKALYVDFDGTLFTQLEDNHAQSGNGGQPSAANETEGEKGDKRALHVDKAAGLLQRQPEQDRSEGGGRVQPEQQGNGPAGESAAAGPGKEEAKPLGGAHGEQGSQGNAADEVKPKTFAEAVKAKKAKAESATIPSVTPKEGAGDKSTQPKQETPAGVPSYEQLLAERNGNPRNLVAPTSKSDEDFLRTNRIPVPNSNEGIRAAIDRIARDRYAEVVKQYQALPDKITGYRAVSVANGVEGLNRDNLGRYWSDKESGAQAYHERRGGTHTAILKATIDKGDLDVTHTLLARMRFATGNDESELNLKDGAKPADPQYKLEGESDFKPLSDATPAPAKGAEHKFKFGNTQADIPPSSDAGKALAELRDSIDPADLMGDGLEKDAHVTVRYGIQGEDTAGIKAFIEQQAPFDATLGPVAKFPPSEHSDGAAPLIAPVESEDLHKLNAEIEKHGDFTEPSFPEYRPHATVAYVKPEAADKYVGDTTTEGATFRVDSIDITDRDGNAETVALKGKQADNKAEEAPNDRPAQPASERPAGGGRKASDTGSPDRERLEPVSPGVLPGSEDEGNVPEGSEGNGPVVRSGSGRLPKPRPRRGSGTGSDTGLDNSPGGLVAEEAEDKAKRQPKRNKDWYEHPEDWHPPAGALTRLDNNLAALEILRDVEKNPRKITDEEKAKLAGYVGWGALSRVFDENYLKKSNEEENPEDYGDTQGYDYNARRWLEGRKETPAYRKERERWREANKRLRELLTEDEYKEATDSTINAHYTSPELVRFMWDAVKRMGFKSGNVLEPSMGVGNFLGMMPPEIRAKVQAVGNDKDTVTTGIAKLLYPEAVIYNKPYEDLILPNNEMDLAISNVPFFEVPVYDRNYPKTKAMLHDYFFLKSMDKVKPGGLVAFITSTGTMDRQRSDIRESLAAQGDLVAAFRLPSTAFKANAGTNVTTDLIILRKRLPGEEPAGEEWMKSTPTKVPIEDDKRKMHELNVNEYYQKHPENLLGTAVASKNMYSSLRYALSKPDRPIEELLKEALERLPKNIVKAAARPTGVTQADTEAVFAVDETLEYSYQVDDKGNIRQKREGKLVPAQAVLDKNGQKLPSKVERMKAMIRLRQSLNDLMYHMKTLPDDEESNSQIKVLREALQKQYDTFVAKHGLLNSVGNNVFREDPHYPRLLALEHYDKAKKSSTPADIFTKRTIYPRQSLSSISQDPGEALQQILGERGYPDMDLMAQLQGKTPKEAAESLVKARVLFRDPITGEYATKEKYLSGYVRTKLDDAKAAVAQGQSEYKANVEELEKVQPEYLHITDSPETSISVRLGGTWIPIPALEAFFKDTLKTDGTFDYRDGTWAVEAQNARTPEITNQWATRRANAVTLLQDSLNLKQTAIFDTDSDGKAHLNPDETTAARAMQERMRQEFQKWALESKEWKEPLEKAYNYAFNNLAETEYDGSFLTFPGMNPEIQLKSHQVNAVWRVIQDGRALLAHEVGAGKTFEMVAAVMEGKRTGVFKKPMIAVPNHIVDQFRKEFMQLYPGANILVPSEKDFDATNRQRIMSQIATGDYDCILLPHSQFNLMDISPERQKKTIQDEMDELDETLRGAIEADPEFKGMTLDEVEAKVGREKGKRGKNQTVKELVKSRLKFKERLKELSDLKADKAINFDDTGVDALFIDEAHEFKNLKYFTKMQRIAGLQQANSKRAFRLLAKLQYLQEVNNGRGVVFATGTPVQNTMAELYTMMKYVAPDVLERAGIRFFDDWAANFGSVITAMELSADGRSFKARSKFARFQNVPELMRMFRAFADVKTAADLNLPRPELEGGKPIVITVPGSEKLDEVVKDLMQRAEDVRSGRVRPDEDNMLKITSEGRKAATDLRLLDKEIKDEQESKINICVSQMLKEYRAGQEDKLTQMAFLDMYRSMDEKENELINLYKDMKAKLVAGGVPENEIAIIGDYGTRAKRQALFDKVNKGEVRILLGSTQKMGSGTNAQKRLKALHHIDLTWRPGDLTQREGRILRQGNTNKSVRIYNYLTERSFDAYMAQTLQSKAEFLSQMLSGRSASRTVTDAAADMVLSLEEMKVAASGNPDIKKKYDLEMRLAQLQTVERAFDASKRDAHLRVETLETSIRSNKNEIQRLEKAQAKIEETKGKDGEGYSMEVDGKKFTSRKDALEYIKAMQMPNVRFYMKVNGVEAAVDPTGTIKEYDPAADKGKGKWIDVPSAAYDLEFEQTSAHFHNNRVPNYTMESVMLSIEARIRAIPNLITRDVQAIKDAEDEVPQFQKLADRKDFPERKELDKTREELKEVEKRLGLGNVNSGSQADKEETAAEVDTSKEPEIEDTDEDESDEDEEDSPEVTKGDTPPTKPEPPTDLNTFYTGFLDPALFKRLFPSVAERTAQWAGDTKTPGDDQRAMMRETRGQMDRRVAIAIFKLRGAAKEWRTRPRAESIDFWNAVENGRIGSLSPKDQALAQVFKAAFDQMRGDLQKLKPEALQNYIENYFPHIWERSSQVTSTIKGMLTGKKPFAGKGGFLKRRTIPTMQDGLDLGFVPKSWNPVDLFVLKYAEMAQFLMGHQTLEVMKDSGTAKFVRIGQKAPEGFTQLDDKIATVYRRVKVLDDDKLDDVTQPLTYPGGKRKIPGAFSEDIEDATHGELALVGHYYAPADAARVFNNFVSRGIAGRSSIYDTLRWLNDNLNGLQLGISAFHATVTTVNAAASDIALGIEQLMQGKPVEAGKSMVSGAAILPTLYRTIRNGSKLMREYLSPGSHAKMTKEADAIAEAGGRVKQNTIELKPFDKAINAFRNGAFFEGLSAVPGAILQGMVAPVLDYYVPRMKVGAFYYMAHNILDEAQRKNWTPELTRTRLQEAWDSIDDRFGQVVYDNLFWHKGLRDTLHLAVRAVGYTYGDIRTYGGAVKDTAKAAVQVGRGKKPRVTPRMAFAVGSFISTALLGGVMTMAWTGHAPQTWKDYTHPMDNTGQRHTIPGYPDQMISAGHDPIQWALNKQAPIWSLMAEAARNSDFNGTEIRHKDDPAIQQIAEVAEWAVKQPIPFSFSNTGKLLEYRGAMPTLASMLHEAEEHPGDIALGNLGFTPAPSFVQHSEALSKAYTYERENRPAGTKTKEQAEKQQAMHSLRSMYASGKVDRQKIAALKAQGIVNERDLLKARLTAKTDPLVRVVKSLTPEQALSVWNVADAKERKELRSTIEEKSRDVYTKIGNPEKRRELQAKYREALRPTFQVRPGSA